jgi:hypothetical protein
MLRAVREVVLVLVVEFVVDLQRHPEIFGGDHVKLLRNGILRVIASKAKQSS